MNLPFDLLLGRKTFEIWEAYWPHHAARWPGVNTATKYVVSTTRTSSQWQPAVFLNESWAENIAHLKQQPGPNVPVWGSGQLVQALMKHALVDAFWLMIYPLTLGVGKRLFAEGSVPMAFQVTQSAITALGVVVVNYERVAR